MWPFDRKLEDVLLKPKKVRVFGVKFIIKKLDITDFLDGSKVMLQSYDIYKLSKSTSGTQEESAKNISKLKDHYRDVFLASVIEPKLSRANDNTGMYVDNLFTEWPLAHELYNEIISYTYGKKKIKLNT